MGEEQPAVVIVEDVECLCEGVCLLAFQGEFFTTVESRVVDEAVRVAAGDALVAQVGGVAIARGGDGVGAQRSRFEVGSGDGDAQHRLLCDVLDEVAVRRARAEAAADHSCQLDETIVVHRRDRRSIPG